MLFHKPCMRGWEESWDEFICLPFVSSRANDDDVHRFPCCCSMVFFPFSFFIASISLPFHVLCCNTNTFWAYKQYYIRAYNFFILETVALVRCKKVALGNSTCALFFNAQLREKWIKAHFIWYKNIVLFGLPRYSTCTCSNRFVKISLALPDATFQCKVTQGTVECETALEQLHNCKILSFDDGKFCIKLIIRAFQNVLLLNVGRLWKLERDIPLCAFVGARPIVVSDTKTSETCPHQLLHTWQTKRLT